MKLAKKLAVATVIGFASLSAQANDNVKNLADAAQCSAVYHIAGVGLQKRDAEVGQRLQTYSKRLRAYGRLGLTKSDPAEYDHFENIALTNWTQRMQNREPGVGEKALDVVRACNIRWNRIVIDNTLIK